MAIRSKWLLVLVGDDRSGKTTLQKKLIKLLSEDNRDIRLDCNLSFPINHPYLIKKIHTFSIANRSIQEKLDVYKSISEYFHSHFCEADLCFVSSHLKIDDIGQIISEGHRRFYNVCGIFLSNSIAANGDCNAEISDLLWDERWIATNEITEDPAQQDRQLQGIAETIVQMFIERTRTW